MAQLPRILMVAPLYHTLRGGLGRQAKLLTERLADEGVPIKVATRKMTDLPEIPYHPWVPIARLDNLRPELHNYDQKTLGNLLVSLSFTFHLMRLLWRQRHRYDCVHFHGASLPLITCVPLLRLCRKTIIAKVAGTKQGVEAGDLRRRYGPLGRLMARILRAVDAYIATTPEIEQALAGEGYAQQQIHAIPNFVEIDVFRRWSEQRRAELRRELDLEERRVVLFAGRLVPLKGVDTLLVAFADLARRIPKSLLLIAGDGPERGYLESLCKQLELDQHVRFLGFQEDMARLYNAADVFCLPSYREGLPNALLEAMSCSLPIVASDIGGCRAAVTPDEGILVPPANPDALAQALTVLVIDAIRRELLGQSCRHRIVESYSIGRVIRRYLQLYRQLAGQDTATVEERRTVYQGKPGCSHD